MAESQKITLRGAMAERADGSWAATRVGDFGPRQGTGKNDKIAARELAGLILLNEPLIIHTAHEFPTANEAFLRLLAVFENYDDLRRQVKRPYFGNGTQSIVFRSGQRILYKARTGGSARGFTKAALVVYDEAQHLIGAHVAASAPAKLANPNAQSWFAGSGGLASSAKAWEMRRQAILGVGGRLAYTEMTAEVIEVVDGKIVCTAPDPLDLNSWYRSMPGLGRWITEESMRALYDELGPDDFAREGQCVWDPEPAAAGEFLVIPAELWRLAAGTGGPSGPLAHALDVDVNARGEEWTSIGCSDGVLLEDVTPPEAVPGTGWVVPMAAAKHREGALSKLWLDPKGPAGKLVGPLKAAGVPVGEIKPDEFSQASMQVVDAVRQQAARHLDQPTLNRAVAALATKDVGDGGFRLSRSLSSGDIGPFVAVMIARWGALQSADQPFFGAWR